GCGTEKVSHSSRDASILDASTPDAAADGAIGRGSDAATGTDGSGETGGAGTAYHVAPNGSDSNPGTESAPFATLNYALGYQNPTSNYVHGGDTLYIHAGSYRSSIGYLPCAIEFDNRSYFYGNHVGRDAIASGDPDRPTTIKAYGDGPVHLNCI